MFLLVIAACLGCADADTTEEPRILCYVDSVSDLEGVEIVISNERCSWTRAELNAGVSIPYEVRVTSAQTVSSWNQFGQCAFPGPSGLFSAFRIYNQQDQEYCFCDVGPCSGFSTRPTNLVEGVHPHIIEWTGKTWNGPSDMDLPPFGPSFSSGVAGLTVSSVGQTSEGVRFKVSSTMALHLRD